MYDVWQPALDLRMADDGRMSILNSLYRPSLALLTDLYELTMAYGYWKAGPPDREAVFHLIFRRSPFRGGFTVAAGLATAIDYLENSRFTAGDAAYLAGLRGNDGKPLFEPAFLDSLCARTSLRHRRRAGRHGGLSPGTAGAGPRTTPASPVVGDRC